MYRLNGTPELSEPNPRYFERISDGYNDLNMDQQYLEDAWERAAEYLDKKYANYSLLDKEYQKNVDNHNAQNLVNDKLVLAFHIGQLYEQYGFEPMSNKESSIFVSTVINSYIYSGSSDFEEYCLKYFDRLTGDFNYDISPAPDNEDEYVKYVAYGSNMNLNDMKVRCPKSKLVSAETLDGYELKFNSCATIVKNDKKSTPVVVWNIHKDDWKILDRYEGYPSFYRRENISININGKDTTAIVYVMNCKDEQYSVPSRQYYNTIKDGYLQNEIPLAPLESALKTSQTSQQKNLVYLNSTERKR